MSSIAPQGAKQTPPENRPATLSPQGGQQVATKTPEAAMTIFNDVTSRVTQLVETGQLDLPQDYSYKNAIRAAMLILVDATGKNDTPVLQYCTPQSIGNALYRMVTSGLSPAKNQGYFLPYGNKLVWQPSYLGNIVIAKRTSGLVEINAQVIYEGDEFEYEVDKNTGKKKLIKHVQKFEHIDMNNIKGGYGIAVFEDGSSDLEVMTMFQVRMAWEQGPQKGQSDAHKKFTDQMVKKTIKSRMAKAIAGASDDSDLFVGEAQEMEKKSNAGMAAKEGVREILITPTVSHPVDTSPQPVTITSTEFTAPKMPQEKPF